MKGYTKHTRVIQQGFSVARTVPNEFDPNWDYSLQLQNDNKGRISLNPGEAEELVKAVVELMQIDQPQPKP